MSAIQKCYTVNRKDERGNWHEEGRFNDEAEAVLHARQVAKAFPFDVVSINEDYD